jgi:hypothetical protein
VPFWFISDWLKAKSLDKIQGMSIEENGQKGKEGDTVEEDFDLVPVSSQKRANFKVHAINLAIIVLIATASFGLGKISRNESERVPIKILESVPLESSSLIPDAKEVKGVSVKSPSTISTSNSSEEVVASKKGTKYHYPWCGGAKQISEANMITFQSIEEARKAGYTPAANCKGLK